MFSQSQVAGIILSVCDECLSLNLLIDHAFKNILLSPNCVKKYRGLLSRKMEEI